MKIPTWRAVLLSLIVVLVSAGSCMAQGSLLRKPAQELFEFILKKFGQEAAQELAEFGGRQGLQELLERAAREGGEELVQKVSRYAEEHGVQALRVIKHSPTRFVRAFDELPSDMLKPAMRAIERNPDTLTDMVAKYGKDVLLAEVRHPGVGAKFIEFYGHAGLQITQNVTTDGLITLTQLSKRIPKLPSGLGKEVIEAVHQKPAAIISFLRQNKGFILTVATAWVIINLPEKVSSMERESHPDGSVIERRRGPFEILLDKMAKPFTAVILIFGVTLTIALAAWLACPVWKTWHISRLKVQREQQKNPPPIREELQAKKLPGKTGV